jgi:hypothetical protein
MKIRSEIRKLERFAFVAYLTYWVEGWTQETSEAFWTLMTHWMAWQDPQVLREKGSELGAAGLWPFLPWETRRTQLLHVVSWASGTHRDPVIPGSSQMVYLHKDERSTPSRSDHFCIYSAEEFQNQTITYWPSVIESGTGYPAMMNTESESLS